MLQSSERSKRKVSWSATCGPCGEAGVSSLSPRATSLLTECARTGPAPSSTRSSSRRTRITRPRNVCTNPLEPGKGAKVSPSGGTSGCGWDRASGGGRNPALDHTLGLGGNLVSLPEEVDGRVHEQLHHEARDQAAHHGGGDPLHQVRARARRPHDWQEREDRGADSHRLGSDALHRPVDDVLDDIRAGPEEALAPVLVVRE